MIQVSAEGCGGAVVLSGAALILAGVTLSVSTAGVATPAVVAGFLANGTAWATCLGIGWNS